MQSGEEKARGRTGLRGPEGALYGYRTTRRTGPRNELPARPAHLLRMAPAQLPRLPPALSMLYLYLGLPERALQGYERIVDVGFLYGDQSAVWHADYALRCHPTTGDDFECD